MFTFVRIFTLPSAHAPFTMGSRRMSVARWDFGALAPLWVPAQVTCTLGFYSFFPLTRVAAISRNIEVTMGRGGEEQVRVLSVSCRQQCCIFTRPSYFWLVNVCTSYKACSKVNQTFWEKDFQWSYIFYWPINTFWSLHPDRLPSREFLINFTFF